MNDNEAAISFYKKMNAIRKDCVDIDWETDKFVSLGGTKGFKYISIYQMKRNLAPLFAKHGIELNPMYHDLQPMPVGAGNVWTVQLDMEMIDMDTGYVSKTTTYGTAPVSNDKGPTIAMAFAMKQWMADKYLLIDGIEPEEGDSPGQRFVKKTPGEVETAKIQVQSNAVKPVQKAPEAKPQETPAPAPVKPVKPAADPVKPKPAVSVKPTVKPAAEPAAEPVKEEVKEPVKEDANPDASSDAPAEAPVQGFKVDKPGLSAPIINTIEHIITVRTQWAKDGKLTPEEYNQMSMDYTEVKDNFTAMKFIKRHKVAE